MRYEQPPHEHEHAVEKKHQKGEIVIVLGASLNDTRHGNYEHFPLHVKGNPKANLTKDGEPIEVVGGDARLRAVSEYLDQFTAQHPDSDINIFTSGGVEKSGKSRAVAAAQKLIKKHALSEEIVHALPSTGSTIGNARALAEWAKDHAEKIGDLQKIKILTNGFHAMRAWAMFTHALHKEYLGTDLAQEMSQEDKRLIADILSQTLNDQENGDAQALAEIQKIYEKYISNDPVRIDALVAEDLLATSGDEAKRKYAHLLRTDDLLQQARANERKGLNDLLAGKYQVK